MRISTNTIFETNVLALNQAQAKFFHTQQQVSTGRRILTASDDPVAATRALEVSQSDDTNTQYATNRTNTINALTTSEANLQGVSALLQDVRDLVITSGQSSLSSAERATFANELQSKLQELIGLANSTDQAGNHMYSGFQSRTQPFVNTPAGVIYMGDDGQRKVQVSASLQLESSDNGADIFMRIKSGNGTFVTAAAGANTGTGVVSLGSVVDTTALTGDNYRIDFTVTGGVTTYSVTDTTTATTVLTAQPYVSGQVISFDGIQFDIKGAPANGDSFTVSPSTNESVFKTISDLVAALNTPVVGANLQNSLSHGIRNVDNALNNVMNVRGAIGLRLNHIDTLAETGVNLGLQYKQTLSTLQDVDYNQAAADLAQQQLMLQAAQQSFVKVAGLSMFNYL
jgi:flagellar hook-associated protein 3 FlgL